MTEASTKPAQILWIRWKNADNSAISDLIPTYKSSSGVLGILLVLGFFARNSLLITIQSLSNYLFLILYLILIIAFALFFLSKEKTSFFQPGALVLLAVFLSCFFSPMRSQALQKGIGWLILFSVLGPFISSPFSIRLRASAWACCRILILFVGFSSIFWYFLHLPLLAGPIFTGVMSHSMLTSPLSAMACLFSIIQALQRRSYYWGWAGLLCIVPTLASGSRAALLGLVAGFLVMLFMVKRFRVIVLLLFTVLFIYLIAGPKGEIYIDDDTILGDMTATLRNKGTKNSRDALWEARINEFKSYPFLGIGVGMGEGEGVVEASGRINIEPGSSYLAILSMTGLFGTIAFMFLSIGLARCFLRNMRQIAVLKRIEILSILMFLFVHAAAEGWILAVGCLLTLIFWVAVGRLFDLSFPK